MVELGHFISSSCTISAVGNRFHEVELGPLLFVSRSEIYIFYSLFYCYFDNTMHNFRCFRCQNIRYEVLFFCPTQMKHKMAACLLDWKLNHRTVQHLLSCAVARRVSLHVFSH